jgi:hypothetical protein
VIAFTDHVAAAFVVAQIGHSMLATMLTALCRPRRWFDGCRCRCGITMFYEPEVTPVMDAATAVVSSGGWCGTATELLHAMARVVPRALLPRTPSHLSAELRLFSPVMEAVGLRVTFGREGHQSRRLIYIDHT